MKIPKNKKPEACVETNGIRFPFKNLNLDGDRLVATNGKVIVSIKVERDLIDRDGAVSVKAIKHARSVAQLKTLLEIILRKKVEQVKDGKGKTAVWYPRPNNTFPEYKKLIITEPCHHRVGIDAKYLSQIASAFGDSRLILEFPKEPLAPIKVFPNTGLGNEDFAVLMPMKI